MGGNGSGGHNKTHGRLEDCQRIDSFSLRNFLNGDSYLDCKEVVKCPVAGGHIVYHVQEVAASVYAGGRYWPLEIAEVLNVDGRACRMYFICPVCEKRARYLYKQEEGYLCRSCAGLNYASQQRGGSSKILHRMRYIVEKQLKYTYWQRENPNILLPALEAIPKPRYMRIEKYEALIKEFRKLQRQYMLKEIQGARHFMKYFNGG